MTAADIPQVMEVERESFAGMWPQAAYRRELNNRLARYLVAVDPSTRVDAEETDARSPARSILDRLLHRGPEAVTRELVLGFVGVWLVVGEAHIVTLGVREAYRRQGIGEWLLIAAIEEALASNQETVTLEVRRSNAAAQALYEKYGFERVGVRPRYYSDNGEDAVIMTTPPITSPAYRAALARLKDAHERRWGYA